MHKKILSLLVCPVCKGGLEYDRKSSELVCKKDRLAFPVNNGVPVLLEMDARKLTSEQ